MSHDLAIGDREKGRPPAFQSYAAHDLHYARAAGLTLAQVGLLHMIRCTQWTDFEVPANPENLARVLGADPADVRAALGPAVMRALEQDGEFLLCGEVARQKRNAQSKRAKQSEGGKKGNAARWEAQAADRGTNRVTDRVTDRVGEERR